MLITCPNCAAGYDVPDHLLAGAVRRLRCARCAVEWDAQAYIGQPNIAAAAIDQLPRVREVQAVLAEPLPAAPLPTAPLPTAWPETTARQDTGLPFGEHAGQLPPPLDDSQLPSGILLSTEAPIRRRAPKEPPRLSALVAAWVLTLFVAGSLGWGVWHWRDDVVTLWPPAQRAFSVVGTH